MPLTIDKLAVRCRAAPERRDILSGIEHWTRHSFEPALNGHMGPSLDRLSGIHLIRRLEVRLRLNPRDWTEAGFLESACKAFSEALFRTLALPASANPAQRAHYEGTIEWRAAFLRWLAWGEREQAWHFDLPGDRPQLDTKSTALLVLLEDQATLSELLRLLQTQGMLAHFAAQWDELAVERIFLAVAAARMHLSEVPPNVRSALEVLARALSVAPPRGKSFGSRQHALLIFSALPAGSAPPRTVFHILQAVRSILEGARHAEASGAAVPLTAILEWREVLERASHSQEWLSLAAVLAVRVPGAASAAQPNAEWIRSDTAGVFLLAPPALALGWRPSSLPISARAFQCLLGAIFQSAIAPFDPGQPRFNPAVSLIAGLSAEPSLADARVILASIDPGLVAQAWNLDSPRGLSDFLEHASRKLLLELGSRVRGFRQAPAEAVARAFVRLPGRIEVTERSLRAIIDAAPYLIALHVSGCDGSQPSFPWLEPVAVTVLLEGV